MSSDSQHRPDQWMNTAFHQWEVNGPSDQLWDQIEESLAVDAVWERMKESLEMEEHASDDWMIASHTDWNPSDPSDGWSKLNDAISLEHVWKGLDQSLNQPVETRLSVWKLAIASIMAIFMTSYLSDGTVYSHSNVSDPVTFVQDQPIDLIDYSDLDQNAMNTVSVDDGANTENSFGERRQDVNHSTDIAIAPLESPKQNTINTTSDSQLAEENVSVDDLNPRSHGLPLEDWSTNSTELTPRLSILPSAQPFHHWTVQVGTQLSILQERNQASLTSTLPKFGIAADLSYRHRLGPIQLIHALGMSQYSQAAGKYINGRYATTNQRINALQYSSSVAYSYKRFTFYGGLMISKMLNGLEQNNMAITQVYNFDQVQFGFTGGVDFRLVSFPNSGKHISIGSQYQWLPSNGGTKTSFEQMQGIRFQGKFSF